MDRVSRSTTKEEPAHLVMDLVAECFDLAKLVVCATKAMRSKGTSCPGRPSRPTFVGT